MFVHHVFFWLKNPENAADQAALVAGLKKLAAVPILLQSHIGVPAPANRDVIDNTYSVSWLTIFNEQADEEVYQDHPIHVDFVNECKHLWKRVLVFDSLDA
jgi:Stress responsive A/B Barrel Domain